MSSEKRPFGFWFIVGFLTISILLMLAGQTMAVFNYDFAVQWGLQERPEEMTEYGVQVNRGFGAGDTVVYIPLMVLSLVGLLLGKRWSLVTTAAVCGISAYWSVTVGFILAFLPGVSGYSNVPGPEIWLFIGTYAVFGLWGMIYLTTRGSALLR